MEDRQMSKHKKLADAKYDIMDCLDELVDKHHLSSLDIMFLLGGIVQRFIEMDMQAQSNQST